MSEQIEFVGKTEDDESRINALEQKNVIGKDAIKLTNKKAFKEFLSRIELGPESTFEKVEFDGRIGVKTFFYDQPKGVMAQGLFVVENFIDPIFAMSPSKLKSLVSLGDKLEMSENKRSMIVKGQDIDVSWMLDIRVSHRSLQISDFVKIATIPTDLVARLVSVSSLLSPKKFSFKSENGILTVTALTDVTDKFATIRAPSEKPFPEEFFQPTIADICSALHGLDVDVYVLPPNEDGRPVPVMFKVRTDVYNLSFALEPVVDEQHE